MDNYGIIYSARNLINNKRYIGQTTCSLEKRRRDGEIYYVEKASDVNLALDLALDAEKGSIQATTYQKDIESKIGFAVPIFLTNGQKWFFKEKGYPTREISGPFSQKDLQRIYPLFITNSFFK